MPFVFVFRRITARINVALGASAIGGLAAYTIHGGYFSWDHSKSTVTRFGPDATPVEMVTNERLVTAADFRPKDRV
ncbi:hypothetical protein Dda_0329 [Drechslerella dactyloides]|uniref:Uncharacterized protein n=1 Tax=Drechslerella dactyloides TaxID=74499 RepID=A0AAD6J502_DREDA|nr:hypothetical protein Dda_0329 [Drechslerella dactyloides]